MGVGVDELDVLVKVHWLLFEEEVVDALVTFTEVHAGACAFSLGEVDGVTSVESVHSLGQLWEELEDLINCLLVVGVGVLHHILAKVADEVGFSEVFVNNSSIGECGEASNKCRFHM